MKSQPLAKDPSKPPLNQAVPLPIGIERHAMIFNDLQLCTVSKSRRVTTDRTDTHTNG